MFEMMRKIAGWEVRMLHSCAIDRGREDRELVLCGNGHFVGVN